MKVSSGVCRRPDDGFDLEIARQAELLPIREVAESIGLDRDDLRLHGPHIAKVNWTRLKESRGSGKGKLILVTSVNPTPFGEGKQSRPLV